MEIIYKRKFLKDLKSLSPKMQAGVKTVLDKLRVATNLETSGVDYALMEGQKQGQNYYRIRVGGYRIGVEYLRPDLIVIIIASRGGIYKEFPPK
jgi:mRNA interferase RelE/StbE